MKIRLLILAMLAPVVLFAGNFTVISADTFGRLTARVQSYRTIYAKDTATRIFRAPDYTPPGEYADLKIAADGDGYTLQAMTEAEKEAQAAAVQAASDAEVENRVNNELSNEEKVQFAVTLQYLNEIIAGRTNLITQAEAQDLLIKKGKELRAAE